MKSACARLFATHIVVAILATLSASATAEQPVAGPHVGQQPAVEVLHRGETRIPKTQIPDNRISSSDNAAAGAIRVVSPRASFPDFPARSASETPDSAASPSPTKNSFAAPAVTVSSALAVVLGLFAALVWLTRKYGSRSLVAGSIPKEVMQSLGSTPIDARTRVTMIRCGNRILVLAQSASGVQPLAEITDPEEIRQLTAACLGDSKQAFASTLRSLEQESLQAGFLGEVSDHPSVAAPTPRDRGRLFATA